MAGCSDEDDEVVATVRKKRDEKKEQQAPQSTVANNEIGYVYNAQNKRDPFKSYFEVGRLGSAIVGIAAI